MRDARPVSDRQALRHALVHGDVKRVAASSPGGKEGRRPPTTARHDPRPNRKTGWLMAHTPITTHTHYSDRPTGPRRTGRAARRSPAAAAAAQPSQHAPRGASAKDGRTRASWAGKEMEREPGGATGSARPHATRCTTENLQQPQRSQCRMTTTACQQNHSCTRDYDMVKTLGAEGRERAAPCGRLSGGGAPRARRSRAREWEWEAAYEHDHHRNVTLVTAVTAVTFDDLAKMSHM